MNKVGMKKWSSRIFKIFGEYFVHTLDINHPLSF